MNSFFTIICLFLSAFSAFSFACIPNGRSLDSMILYPVNRIVIGYPTLSQSSSYDQILNDKSGRYTTMGDKLYVDQKLRVNSYLLSPNKAFLGIMQTDGNFVIYSVTGSVKFATSTFGANTELLLQTDGNIVIYRNGKPMWSSNRYSNYMCQQRCTLALENDGSLSAYKGDIFWTNKYWSTGSYISLEQFNRIAIRNDPEDCPIAERVSKTTFSWQEESHSTELDDIKEGHDELRRRKRADEVNRNNIFADYANRNPRWAGTFGLFMLSTGELESYTSRVTQDPQIIYYMRMNEGFFLWRRSVARYVATIVQPYHINTGQGTTQAARDWTDELARVSGLQQRSNRDGYASLDAGHVLASQLGGPVDRWNLYPQNGQINRWVWAQIETEVQRRVSNEFLTLVAEYWLEYSDTYPTVPTYVHYSFRLFNPIRNNEHVHTMTGIIPNYIPDGRRRMIQTLTLAYPGNENSSEERLVTYESTTTTNLPNLELEEGYVLQLFNRANRQCNRNGGRGPG